MSFGALNTQKFLYISLLLFAFLRMFCLVRLVMISVNVISDIFMNYLHIWKNCIT